MCLECIFISKITKGKGKRKEETIAKIQREEKQIINTTFLYHVKKIITRGVMKEFDGLYRFHNHS
jgi:hypothetical protein